MSRLESRQQLGRLKASWIDSYSLKLSTTMERTLVEATADDLQADDASLHNMAQVLRMSSPGRSYRRVKSTQPLLIEL